MIDQPSLHAAVAAYQQALQLLQQTAPSLDARQVLALLATRDTVQAALTIPAPHATEDLAHLFELDLKLKKLAVPIVAVVDLSVWRQSFMPLEKGWWWSLETLVPESRHRLDRFDWAWQILTLVALTAAGTLATQISSRFLKEGPDFWGSFAVLIQSTLTVLTARGVLSKNGRREVESFFQRWQIPAYLWAELKLAFATGLLLLLFLLQLALPIFARLYNQAGLQSQQAAHLQLAEEQLSRAIALNPDVSLFYYDLAIVEASLLQKDDARTHLQIALNGGELDAAHHLARLQIEDGQFAAAAVMLQQNLLLVEPNSDPAYDLLTDLGWVRLEQGRLKEAAGYLRQAEAMRPEEAAAHCLLGRLFQANGELKAATAAWQACARFADNDLELESIYKVEAESVLQEIESED